METRYQTTARNGHSFLRLLTSIPSPYTRELSGIGNVGRNTHRFLNMKAYLDNFIVTAGGTSYAGVTFIDDTMGNAFVGSQFIPSDFSADTSSETIFTQAKTDILAYAAAQGYGATTVFGMFATTNGTANAMTESALSLSLQTSTGAVGTQVSATKGAWVTITGSVSTTATIGGSGAGHIVVEVAPTNSATAGDWVEKGRVGNTQTITLAIALNSVQLTEGTVVTYVPAGYYVKARSFGTGTFTNTLLEARQVI